MATLKISDALKQKKEAARKVAEELKNLELQEQPKVKAELEEKEKEFLDLVTQYNEQFGVKYVSPFKPEKKPATDTLSAQTFAKITDNHIMEFIEQKHAGITVDKIKVSGKRSDLIAKIGIAYEKASVKDPPTIKAELKKMITKVVRKPV